MNGYPKGTAAAEGLACCHVCFKVTPEALHRCPRCGASLHLRVPESLQRTVALIVTASLLYIPANVLPIMTTEQLGRATDSTIIGGVVLLVHHGDYPIAAVIFIASVLVVIRVAAVRGDRVDRLRKLTRSDLDFLLVAAQLEIDAEGIAHQVLPGPSLDVLHRGNTIQFGLTRREIDGTWDRIQELIGEVDAGKLPTF